MSPTIQQQIDSLNELNIRNFTQTAEYIQWLRQTMSNVNPSGSVEYSLSSCMPWITVDNREDLAEFMKLAPTWNKRVSGNKIVYSAQVGSYTIELYARDAALPKTCRVVEETVVTPAVPERTETIERVVCDI